MLQSALLMVKQNSYVYVLCGAAPGSRVEQWLRTPFDVLTFGPRAGVGALVSLPERLTML